MDLIRSRVRAALYPLRTRMSQSRPAPTALWSFTHLLQARGVTHVIDVGANRGLFGEAIRAAGFDGHIASFEPVEDAFRRLAQRAAIDGKWSCERVALGSTDAEATINVSANSVSSSLLAMEPEVVSVAPDAAYIGAQRIRQRRLDDAMAAHGTGGLVAAIKLDVQGYELQVLEGAPMLLRDVCVLQTELSLVPLYVGQPDWRQMIDELQDRGFALHTIEPMFYDGSSGRTLQVDAVFARPGSFPRAAVRYSSARR